MCFILILVHLQFVAGMSAMLDVFVVRYQYLPKSDLGRIWHYADDTGWFDLVLGSDVTM